MILPQIPTDNLYKFLFVSGLTLIGASVLLFINKYKEIEDEMYLVNLDMVNHHNKFFRDSLSLTLETEQILERNEEDSIERERLINLIKDKKINSSDLQAVKSKILLERDETWKSKKNSNEILAYYNDQKTLRDFKIKELKHQNKKLVWIIIISAFGFIFGLFFTIYGYKKWELNVQKPIDQRIKIELEQLRLNNRKEA